MIQWPFCSQTEPWTQSLLRFSTFGRPLVEKLNISLSLSHMLHQFVLISHVYYVNLSCIHTIYHMPPSPPSIYDSPYVVLPYGLYDSPASVNYITLQEECNKPFNVYDTREKEERQEVEKRSDHEEYYEDDSQEALQVLGAYKKVDVRVRPVPGVFPQEAMVHRQFPNNPLANLPTLPKHPPEFTPTAKLTDERMKAIDINRKGFLWPEEEKLFKHILALNEASVAFIEEDRGTFKKSYFSDYIIPTIPHIPWNFKNIPIPPGIKEDVIKLLKDKIRAGVYEPSQASYRSRWFCVRKKNGKLRIVHDLQPLNAVTIKDSGLPPIVEDFVEPFAGHQCYTVLDLFWGFDGRKIDPKSRDLTSFITPLGLLRITSLPMGFTNSPAEFQQCTTFILQDEIPHKANIFIDDLAIKGPKLQYLDKEGK